MLATFGYRARVTGQVAARVEPVTSKDLAGQVAIAANVTGQRRLEQLARPALRVALRLNCDDDTP